MFQKGLHCDTQLSEYQTVHSNTRGALKPHAYLASPRHLLHGDSAQATFAGVAVVHVHEVDSQQLEGLQKKHRQHRSKDLKTTVHNPLD